MADRTVFCRSAIEQIRHHRPARPLGKAGPWLDHWPPEDQGSEKEAGMLKLVP